MDACEESLNRGRILENPVVEVDTDQSFVHFDELYTSISEESAYAFLAVAFFAAGFLADFLAAGFLVVAFLAAGFLVVAFLVAVFFLGAYCYTNHVNTLVSEHLQIES